MTATFFFLPYISTAPPASTILPNALSGCFSQWSKKVNVTWPTMPGNQDGDKNQMSLAKASAISWAWKSTRSPTGSEWNDASEQKFVRPGPDQTGHSVRVGVIDRPQGTAAEIKNRKPLGISVYNQPGGFCLWPYKVKGSFRGVAMLLFTRGHITVGNGTSSEGWQSLQVVLTAKIRSALSNLSSN